MVEMVLPPSSSKRTRISYSESSNNSTKTTSAPGAASSSPALPMIFQHYLNPVGFDDSEAVEQEVVEQVEQQVQDRTKTSSSTTFSSKSAVLPQESDSAFI